MQTCTFHAHYLEHYPKLVTDEGHDDVPHEGQVCLVEIMICLGSNKFSQAIFLARQCLHIKWMGQLLVNHRR